MKDEDKSIDQIRAERDDFAALLKRMLFATRPGATLENLYKSRLRERAAAYLGGQAKEPDPIQLKVLSELTEQAQELGMGY